MNVLNDLKIVSFRTLIIILMRLRNDGSKNEFFVRIPESLHFRGKVTTACTAGNENFRLTGIINHRGKTTKEGAVFFIVLYKYYRKYFTYDGH